MNGGLPTTYAFRRWNDIVPVDLQSVAEMDCWRDTDREPVGCSTKLPCEFLIRLLIHEKHGGLRDTRRPLFDFYAKELRNPYPRQRVNVKHQLLIT
jgi:hypothetical protein